MFIGFFLSPNILGTLGASSIEPFFVSSFWWLPAGMEAVQEELLDYRPIKRLQFTQVHTTELAP